MILTLAWLVLVLSLLAWIGQLISLLAPKTAERFGLTEPWDEVDPVFYADGRAECLWDSLTLWTLPLAAFLLILDNPFWILWGFTGGGMYIYFAGRGIAQRITMQLRDIDVGKIPALKTAFIFLALWGCCGMVMIALAFASINRIYAP